jgi:hypothetical protein
VLQAASQPGYYAAVALPTSAECVPMAGASSSEQPRSPEERGVMHEGPVCMGKRRLRPAQDSLVGAAAFGADLDCSAASSSVTVCTWRTPDEASALMLAVALAGT